jgi:hypothetical protein
MLSAEPSDTGLGEVAPPPVERTPPRLARNKSGGAHASKQQCGDRYVGMMNHPVGLEHSESRGGRDRGASDPAMPNRGVPLWISTRL